MHGGLLLADEDVHGRAREVPALADFVLEEAAVGVLDVLREVGIEDKRGYLRGRELCAILDFDVLALD